MKIPDFAEVVTDNRDSDYRCDWSGQPEREYKLGLMWRGQIIAKSDWLPREDVPDELAYPY